MGVPAGERDDERFARWMELSTRRADDEVCLRVLFRCPHCGATLRLMIVQHWEPDRQLVAACPACNVIETQQEWAHRSAH